MKRFLLTTALIALGSATALAQDAPRNPNQMNQPAIEAVPPVDEAPAQTAAFIARQEAEQSLSGDLIGATVYNAAAEALGDISDLIVEKDGTITGVILGVGGFLGIGQKEVAIPFAAIETIPNSDGEPHLVFNVETDALEAAPDYIRLTEADAIADDDEEVASEILDADAPVAADATVDADGDGVPAGRDPDDLNAERR